MTATTTGIRCRRQTVTVLFVDIVNYTGIIDELDCADVRDLQVDYFSAVSAQVRAAGGVVEKFIGDAVMAVYGTAGPAAGTPDEVSSDEVSSEEVSCAATRAVRSGLLIQETLRGSLLAGRFPVHTRVGVATGDAIVDPAQTRDGGYAMVSGSVVSTAARLQAYAPHDTVVVCATTREVTDQTMAYQELPPVSVAGKAAPVELSRALYPQAVTAWPALQMCG